MAFDKRHAFTLVELLAMIAVIGALVTVGLFYVADYITTSKRVADKRTLVVLNDALTRYKCEGGDMNALTSGAQIKNVLAKMQQAITWAGFKHQILQPGNLYLGRSLDAIGEKQQYHFTRFNNYTEEAGGSSPGGLVYYTANNGGLEYIGYRRDGATRYSIFGGIKLMQPYTASHANYNSSMPHSFTTVCLDISGHLVLGNTYTFEPKVFQGIAGVLANWGAGNAGAINNPGNARAALQAAADLFYRNSSRLSGSITDKAGLQIAIFEALYDTDTTQPGLGLNLDAGRFIVNASTDQYAINDAAAVTLAASMITTINPSVATQDLYPGLIFSPNPAIQDGGRNITQLFYKVNP